MPRKPKRTCTVLSLEELMNIDIVSASKKAESSFVSPLSSTVLTQDEILASGATTIEEALRLVPGMLIRETSNGNFDVHIRGNDNLPPGNIL
jgi:iron complex outermembrane receptor protein